MFTKKMNIILLLAFVNVQVVSSQMAGSSNPTTRIVSTGIVAPTTRIVSTGIVVPTTHIVSTGIVAPTTRIVSTGIVAPTTRIISTEIVVPTTHIVSTGIVAPTTHIVSTGIVAPTTHIVSTGNLMTTSLASPTQAVSTNYVVSTESLASTTALTSHISPTPSATVVPSSSSSIYTSTTPKTSTTPRPEDLNVTVSDPADNKTCLWLAADIQVEYDYLVNKTKKNGTLMLTTNDLRSTPQGICSNFSKPNSISQINLKYPNYDLVLTFESEEDGWRFSQIDFSLDVESLDLLDDSIVTLFGNYTFENDTNDGFFRGQKGHSYECDQKESKQLTTNSSTSHITVTFNNVVVQPFKNDGKETDKTVSCPTGESSPKSSSIVPIAVGCALAGLIVIVLIAYLIGRRKSDSRGYQQV